LIHVLAQILLKSVNREGPKQRVDNYLTKISIFNATSRN